MIWNKIKKTFTSLTLPKSGFDVSYYQVKSKFCNTNGYFLVLEATLSEEARLKYGSYQCCSETFKVTEENFNETKLNEEFILEFKKRI